MHIHRWLFHLLVASFLILSCSGLMRRTLRVGYIVIDESRSPGDKEIWEWLESHERFDPQEIHLKEVASSENRIDVFWLDLPDSTAYHHWLTDPDFLQIFKSLLQRNPRLFLTNYGALLPHALGLESRKPEVRRIQVQDNWLEDQKGLQGWRDHPVFAGLFGGTFLLDGVHGDTLSCIGYFGDNFPMEGKVVAVEKSFITVHRENRLMQEYQREKGKILSVGAFIHFSQRNGLKKNLQKFVENCLLYLCGAKMGVSPTYWKSYAYRPQTFSVITKSIHPVSERKWMTPSESELLLTADHPKNDFYDLAGRRALIMGKEKGGIDEIWVHPFRILRDYEVGLVTGDSIAWLRSLPVRAEIRPESITRYYQTMFGEIKEILFPSLRKAGAVVHYEVTDSLDVQMAIRFRSDLRWMWPYDEYALGDVHFGYDGRLDALHIKDETAAFYCVFGGDVGSDQHLEGPFESIGWEQGRFIGRETELNQVYHASVFSLNRENDHCLNVVLVGTDQGKEEALSHYISLMRDPLKEYETVVAHYQKILNDFVTIDSPDDEFDRLWKWALVGTDRFFVHTPDLGTALVAGYATTERGWDGQHKISGRPGYGWYFGRDAAWSGFAVDDYGDFNIVEEQLRFFQKFQDESGKIFHELSTSGAVHYDAADATPLYVILAAHLFRASGDTQFLRENWPHLQRAMNYLYSTDTDGDGLIENTDVGHGWVEGGKLWGAHTTFYLAGLWAQALKDAAYMVSHLGKQDLADKYRQDAEKVQMILNKNFWSESDKFFYYGKFADGSYNPEETVLPAVVMYYNLLDDEKAKIVLMKYASNRFTSDWGMRILSSESPLFNPRGYHYGSVWPLYTGWTALAEYEYGNPTQGFTHIYSNLMIKNHWARGFVEEVMNGAVYQPSGVCPHQCWSETNILHPGITGMIGWKPHAPEGFAELKPRFPIHWKLVRVDHLRVGDSRIGLEIIRSKNETHYDLTLEDGREIEVHLYPEIHPGMIVDDILIDDQAVVFSSKSHRGLLAQPVELALRDEVSVVLKHRRGIEMLPILPRPEPGGRSQDYRIVNTTLHANRYVMDLEGRAGSEYAFTLRLFDQKINNIDGGRIRHIGKTGLVTLMVPFPHANESFSQKRVILHLNEIEP